MPPPKVKTLTIKEMGFVRDLIRTGNGTESVIQNYNVNKKGTAYQMATQLRKKPHIQKAIAQAFEDKGLTIDKFAELTTKTAEIGAGVEATAKDSISALRLYADVMGLRKQTQTTKAYKETIRELSTGEVVRVLERQATISQTLLDELADKV